MEQIYYNQNNNANGATGAKKRTFGQMLAKKAFILICVLMPFIVQGQNTAPTFTAQPTNQTVTTGWIATFTAVANGNPAPTLQWYQATSTGMFTSLPGGTSATLTLPAATESMNGNKYFCTAVNSEGYAASDTVTLTVNVATSPEAPGFFTATPGDGQVTLSWTAPSNGGSTITGYQVSSNNGESWTSLGQSARTHTFDGLTNGTSYTFKVRAVNSVGAGAEATVTATPAAPATTPAAPENFTATPGDKYVALSWTVPSDGGSPITGYQVSKDNGENWTSLGQNIHGYFMTGLTNGTSYTFKVRAVNSVGVGTEATVSATPVAPATTPAAPGNFIATPGDGQVKLTWTAPSDDGGSPITGYEVSKDNGASWTSLTQNNHTFTFTDLTNGTSYTFKVRAENSTGIGAEATATATPAATTATKAPPVITTTTLPEGQQDEVYAPFTLAATGDQPITWSISTGNLPAGITLSTAGVLSGTPTLPGSFTFTVKATNEAGNNEKSLTLVVAQSTDNARIAAGNTLRAWTRNGILHIEGITSGEILRIYSAAGLLIYQNTVSSVTADIPLHAQGIYLVQQGRQTVKVINN